jgi:hypothetical protein
MTLLTASVHSRTHVPRTPDGALSPVSTLYFSLIHTKATTRGSPRCNSRCPTARAPRGAYCMRPFLQWLSPSHASSPRSRLITSPSSAQSSPGRQYGHHNPGTRGPTNRSRYVCVCAPPPPLQRGTNKVDKQWTPRHSGWQDFEKHNRLATRESQILGA